MEFEWDEEKNQKNIIKHGISFESAEEIFSEPVLKKIDARKDYGEERWIVLGKLRVVCVVLVYTPKLLKIRVISIRRANREETKTYKDRFQAS